jgi:mRNA interferase RelE/StbE
MFAVRYSKTALKGLTKMPRGIALRIQTELAAIATDPRAYRGDWKPLEGSAYWRLRVGDWRAVCERKDDVLIIHVLKIAPRGDVYK